MTKKGKENKPYKNNCMTLGEGFKFTKTRKFQIKARYSGPHCLFSHMDVSVTRILSSLVFLAFHFDTQQRSHYSRRNDLHSLRLSCFLCWDWYLEFWRSNFKQKGLFVSILPESWPSLLKIDALQKKDHNWFQYCLKNTSPVNKNQRKLRSKLHKKGDSQGNCRGSQTLELCTSVCWSISGIASCKAALPKRNQDIFIPIIIIFSPWLAKSTQTSL